MKKIQNDRMVFLLANLQGQLVEVSVKNGNIYQGIFNSYSNGALKLRLVKLQSKSNNTTSDTMIISKDELVQISAQEMHFAKHVIKTDFKVDGAITKTKQIREKELVKWTPSSDEMNMADTSPAFDKNTKWDQFEINAKQFGVKSTYSEHLYTTELDKSSEFWKKNHKNAELMALEIESKTSTNIQITIDRNQNVDLDEEELYSSVKRSGDVGFLQIVREKRSSSLSQYRRTGPEIDEIIERNRAISLLPSVEQRKTQRSTLAALGLDPMTPVVTKDMMKEWSEFKRPQKNRATEMRELLDFSKNYGKAKATTPSLKDIKTKLKPDAREKKELKKKEIEKKKTWATATIHEGKVNDQYLAAFVHNPQLSGYDWNIIQTEESKITYLISPPRMQFVPHQFTAPVKQYQAQQVQQVAPSREFTPSPKVLSSLVATTPPFQPSVKAAPFVPRSDATAFQPSKPK